MKKVLFTILTSFLLIAPFFITSCDNFDYNGKVIIDTGATGAAFNRIKDVDGDGLNDIVLSQFGTKPAFQGEVAIYYNRSYKIPMYFDFKKEVLFDATEDVCFPNETTVYDIDNDGDMDIFAPSGFISCLAPRFDENGQMVPRQWGLVWFEKKNQKWERHDLVPYGTSINGADNLFFHKAEIADIDNDGIMDLVTVGETMIVAPPIPGVPPTPPSAYAETYWFKGTKNKERFESTPRLIGRGGGGLPFTYDIDGDGDLDIFSAQYFGYMDNFNSNAFIWFENVNSGNEWVFHTLSQPFMIPNGPPVPISHFGPSIQLSVVKNFIEEGKDVFVGANHTNSASHPDWPHEAVFMFDISNPLATLWDFEILSAEMQSRPNPERGEQGSPGVFDSGDIDGDGDIDLVVSGDGDTNIYVIEQVSPGIFETVVLDTDLGQAGVSVGDLTGDGIDEIVVSSYEQNSLIIYDYRVYKKMK